VGIKILDEINNKIKVLVGRRDIAVEFLIIQYDFHRASLTLWGNLKDNLIAFVKIKAMSIQSSKNYQLLFLVYFDLLLHNLNLSLCQNKIKGGHDQFGWGKIHARINMQNRFPSSIFFLKKKKIENFTLNP
jgi:hypothetical protein